MGHTGKGETFRIRMNAPERVEHSGKDGTHRKGQNTPERAERSGKAGTAKHAAGMQQSTPAPRQPHRH